VLDGLRGEDSIAELCRKEGIAQSLYYTWSKEFMEAGSAAWPVTPPAPRPAARCRICAARPAP
jgi:transposase